MGILKNAALAVAVVFGVISQSAEATTVAPFTLTQGSLSATFEGLPFPDGAVLIGAPPAQFQGLSGGVVLVDAAPALIISFSQQITDIEFNFVEDTMVPDGLDFAVFTGGFGGTMVDSGLVPSAVPPGFAFAEGKLIYGANAFDTIGMEAASITEFAIDNLYVRTSTGQAYLFTFDAPEPLTLALFGAGLMGAGALRRRKASTAL